MQDQYGCEVNWERNPAATHYIPDTGCYYFKQDDVWQLILMDGISHCRSMSMYNNDSNESQMIAKESV